MTGIIELAQKDVKIVLWMSKNFQRLTWEKRNVYKRTNDTARKKYLKKWWSNFSYLIEVINT